MNQFYVYIMSSSNRALYIGVTNNLERWVLEHKSKEIEGFTRKYNVTRLVYFEHTTDVKAALEREKQLKRWNRAKKMVLIESLNPKWEDLSLGWFA
jgi:putative endonuclease